MLCTSCRVYEGTPVCGACRAASRILGIVQGGHLPLAREEVVLGILRGCAGALCDLAEEVDIKAKGVAKEHPANKGEDTGPIPGAKRLKKEEPPKKEERSASYSYETDPEEEEGKDQEEKPDYGRDSPEPRRERRQHREGVSENPQASGSGAKPSARGKVSGGVDPHYLTKALNPLALPKWSAAYKEAAGAEEEEEIVEEEPPREKSRHHDRKEKHGPGGDGSRKPRSPDRAPLQRRNPPHPKGKRRRGSGGQAKKQRGRDFKQWVEEQRRQKKEKQQWHQRRR
eukprot:Skav216597  [mRNA]  locus=scaffold2855:143086:143937:+ [translate_table: standard]